jgi:hypothetical protein
MPLTRRSLQLIALTLSLVAAMLFLIGYVPARGLAAAPLGITITPTEEDGKVTLTPTSEMGQPTDTPGYHATVVPRPVVPGGGGNLSIVLFSSLFLIAAILFGASFLIKKPR